MESIFTVLLEAIVYLISEILVEYIIKYPGAFIRWLFLYKRKTFKEIYYDRGWNFNYLISILLWLTIISLVAYLI